MSFYDCDHFVTERGLGSSCPFAVHFYIINEVFNRQLSFSVLQIEPPSLLHQPSSATSTAFDVIKNFFWRKTNVKQCIVNYLCNHCVNILFCSSLKSNVFNVMFFSFC